MYGDSHQKFFQQTVTNITGLPLSADLNGGEPNCVSFVPVVRLTPAFRSFAETGIEH